MSKTEFMLNVAGRDSGMGRCLWLFLLAGRAGSDAAGAANDSVCAGGRNGVTLEEGCLSTGLSILNEKFVLIQVVHVGRWQNVCYNELNGYKEQMQTCHSLFRRRLLSDY